MAKGFNGKVTGMIGRFCADRSGNFAVTAAFVLSAAVMSIGAAVDYTRMQQTRSDYQNALDSATLATAIAFRTQSWDDAKRAGVDHFRSNHVVARDVTAAAPVFTRNGDIITGTLDSEIRTSFLKIAGFDALPYKVTAAVNSPDYPIEVAMVLDTTGSMLADNKIDTLKQAARDFVEIILRNPNADRKVAIVPFAQYVNVGRDKLGQPWLDARDEVVNVPEQCSMQRDLLSKSGCRTEYTNHPRRWIDETCSPAQYNDGVMVRPASCTPGHWQDAYTSSSEVCDSYTYSDPYQVCQPAYSYTIEWNGCVATRRFPHNIRDRDYHHRVPGPNNLTCPSEITALTGNQATLNSAINSINAVGQTYISQGVTWGLRTLSPGAPFTGGRGIAQMEALNGRKFLVLMTDGENVVSQDYPYSPRHQGNDINQSDDWLTRACDEVKDTDIEIYTVAFGTSVPPDTRDLLRSCASSNNHYFHAVSNAAFKQTFRKIADEIIKLRLTM